MFIGYNTAGTNYAQAQTVAGDVIMAQTQTTFDEAGSGIAVAVSQRLNDATGVGPLCPCEQPAARVSTSATWFDGIARSVATANFGTGSRSALPPTATGGVITTATAYDVAGRAYQNTDPKGVVGQTGYDNANQTTQTIEDVGGLNRTTNFTWTLDGQKSTMTAVNAVTGDQTTTWGFGTTLTDSGVARNDLLRYIDYPDSVAGSDREAFTYNRLGEKQTRANQRGNARTLVRDVLGRETNDCVTTLGSATDGTVLQIARTYEIRGMVSTVTSFDSATPNSGTILNQCALSYNDFTQLALEQQEHSGAVTGSSPSVGYAYATGSGGSNQIRFTNLIYPNGRNIANSFGASGGMNDLLNRIEALQDVTSGTTTLASYVYLGFATPVRIIYPEPQVWLDLWGGVSGQFAGLDQFNRVIDQRWQNNINTTPTDIDRYQLGHDANSNPLYKANIVGTPNVAGGLDELYGTDTLNRLVQMQRGVLNAARTAITGTPAREMDWTLDPTGNWPAYVTQTAGTTDLNQGRTSNLVNEITGITASGGTPVWVTPAYDAAGNMTTMPQPGTPTSAFTAVYDAWKRMVSINAGGGAVGLYQYDGRRRRIVSVTTETRHFYFTDSWQDIEQRVGSATTMDQQHVWEIRYIDELVCRDDATPERLYATQDAIFSVTCLTDTSGTPQQRSVYDPYGFAAIMTGAWLATTDAFGWGRRLSGQRYDAETQNYLYRERYYSTSVGTFLTRDPTGYDAGLSLFQYTHSSPMVRVDPYGSTDAAVGISPLAGPQTRPSGSADDIRKWLGLPPEPKPKPKPAPRTQPSLWGKPPVDPTSPFHTPLPQKPNVWPFNCPHYTDRNNKAVTALASAWAASNDPDVQAFQALQSTKPAVDVAGNAVANTGQHAAYLADQVNRKRASAMAQYAEVLIYDCFYQLIDELECLGDPFLH